MLTFWFVFGFLAADIHLEPRVIGHCSTAGLGAARVVWTAEPDSAPVTVRVGSRAIPMTGPETASGSARTGEWIADGTEFVLTDRTGAEIARTRAIVDCGRLGQVERALAASSYWPLEVGNRWVYRFDSRQITGDYIVEEVTAAERIDGLLYYVVEPGGRRLRTDDAGRVWQRVDAGDRLLLDPTDAPAPTAALTVTAKGVSYTSPLGDFADSLQYSASAPLRLEFGVFVHGIGRIESSANVLAGSSGGFSDSRKLVEARLGGRLIYRASAGSPAIEIEADRLDVSGRRVTNCAVPCYFVACGLVPGADPPNTYKPCAQVRASWPGLREPAELAIEDAAGRASWRRELAAGAFDDGPIWVSAPLYERPNEPLVPGRYWLRLRSGDREARVSLTLD